MDHRTKLMNNVKKHTRLAITYADDGAWMTGAKLLREAADMLEEEGKRINRLINPEG